ncbi:MAG: flagellar biosynthesis protein FlgC [Kordiimonadaceae bacterium]|jgi:flagellar basal-body rod protein FlgC|nr:flagellar biosynthesis protein FlgC [Kordiimonadaceae bacterium]MBT7582021.1 flagellar biosynthesis protein FlgC [Kordiimonadaceae bacterium]
MISGINTSLSGLLAASTRANTAANNIVNAYNTSAPVGGDASTAALRTSRAYVPQRTINSSQKNGGVVATNVPVSPSSLSIYSPSNPVSNDEGFVNIPNVDAAVEFSELIKAKHAYKANAAVLRTLFETQEAALDIIK